MGIGSFFRRLGRSTVDSAVNFADGKTTIRPLDSNIRAYRTVLIVGAVALAGSGLVFWTNIHRAYDIMHPKPVNHTVAASAEMEALKTKDTDQDGLSDYDELFNYHSSPYLFSTAGDGISDGTKVQKGENPSCAENTACNPAASLNLNVNGDSTLTPAYLRSALKAAGVSAATLDATNDSDLLAIYSRVVGSATNRNFNTNSASTLTMDQLQNLSGSEVRSLLIANGISASTLSTVDDGTLQQIFQQITTADTNTNSSNVN